MTAFVILCDDGAEEYHIRIHLFEIPHGCVIVMLPTDRDLVRPRIEYHAVLRVMTKAEIDGVLSDLAAQGIADEQGIQDRGA